MEDVEVGFIGLGVMGQPMALNLIRAGTALVVWNRSAEKSEVLRAAGASVAQSPSEVFRRARTVILMLVDGAAIDSVLGRGTPNFSTNVAQHTIVHMGTTAPDYSRALEADIRSAGGEYVEAPVSGSRMPAEQGKLLAMIAGLDETVTRVRGLLRPMCSEVLECGTVPNATLTKLATNIVLMSTITGLSEAMHIADRQGLPREQLMRALLLGPLASDVLRVKAPKLVARDFTPQASILSALANAELTYAAAQAAGARTALLSECIALYKETRASGDGELDLIAVIKAMEARDR
ncbi:MAG: NAD(P)-dependent oxidoreductase [Sulfurifustaceae bacterium]